MTNIAKEFISANAALYELAVKSMGLGRLDAILGDYQQRWDADEAFDLSKIGMRNAFDPEAWKRKPNNEATELTACLSEIASKVEKELLDAWTTRYDRQQMQAILDALCAIDPDGTLIIGGRTIYYTQIAESWNYVHGKDRALYIDRGFDI